MTVSHWQADDTQPVREVDVLIVGAGIVGAAAANFAAQAGRDVVVIDARDAGLGASGRNAGFMITGLDTYYHRAIDTYGRAVVRELWQLSLQTHKYWRQWAQAGAVPLDECGSLLLAESEIEKAELERAARLLNEDGIAVEYIDHDLLGRGYFAAIRQPWDAAVQPFKLANTILSQSNAEFIANNEAYRIKQTGPECVRVYTRKVIFEARYVLLCTNAYSPRLHSYFAGKVIPTRAQCLVTEPLKSPVLDTCGYSDYGYMYYRMTFDKRLLIGGGRKQNKPLENDTTEDRVTEPVQAVLDAYLRERFPDVTVPVARRWAGIMGFSVDGLPLVGTLPDAPRIGFAVGFTGHGLAMGAGCAERAVGLLLQGASAGAVDAKRLAKE